MSRAEARRLEEIGLRLDLLGRRIERLREEVETLPEPTEEELRSLRRMDQVALGAALLGALSWALVLWGALSH